ncbi:MAG: PIN domain-containing protein, partial [Bacteroidaceae bacterium]|nr:PIN domain-containing protein [Bacteroidaceae bacterium]
MMRLLLDTCVIIEWLTDPDSIGDKVWDIINEPRCKLYVSAETARELIVSFNNKNLLPKYWKTAEEMLLAIKDEAMVDILPISEPTMFTYSRLQLNVAQDHKDPSDHVIISHA